MPADDPTVVDGVAATLDTWGLPATWTCTPPPATCYVYDSRTDALMPDASCSLGEPQVIWYDSGWPRLDVDFSVVQQSLPADMVDASRWAYVSFSFTVSPAAPGWWSWPDAGIDPGQRNNWCSASLARIPGGVHVSGRSPENWGTGWGLGFRFDQSGTTTATNTCPA